MYTEHVTQEYFNWLCYSAQFPGGDPKPVDHEYAFQSIGHAAIQLDETQFELFRKIYSARISRI